MTMPDLNPTPARLPLRITPAPGESLRGYLARLAGIYACRPLDVITPISRTWAGLLAFSTVRTMGIAMTAATADAFGWRCNLEPEEVGSLLYGADATTLTLRPGDDVLFDPVYGTATPSDLRSRGWFGRLGQHRWCPACVARTPGLALRSWTRPWNLACEEHHVPLAGQDLVAFSPDEWERYLQLQEHLSDITAGARRFTYVSAPDGFADLHAFWTTMIIRTAVETGRRQVRTDFPQRVTDLLAAMRLVESPVDQWPATLKLDQRLLDTLELYGSTSPFGACGRIAATPRRFRASVKLRSTQERLIAQEQAPVTAALADRITTHAGKPMPQELAIPTLGDYTPDMPVTTVCAAAGELVPLLATGLPESPRWRAGLPLRQVMWQLSYQGVWSDYCADVRALTPRMLDLFEAASQPAGEEHVA